MCKNKNTSKKTDWNKFYIFTNDKFIYYLENWYINWSESQPIQITRIIACVHTFHTRTEHLRDQVRVQRQVLFHSIPSLALLLFEGLPLLPLKEKTICIWQRKIMQIGKLKQKSLSFHHSLNYSFNRNYHIFAYYLHNKITGYQQNKQIS